MEPNIGVRRAERFAGNIGHQHATTYKRAIDRVPKKDPSRVEKRETVDHHALIFRDLQVLSGMTISSLSCAFHLQTEPCLGAKQP